jgi:[acyl-carrier-protein] S-malonyltransferase
VSGGERIGLLFPGQGSQAVGMGRDLAERSPRVRELYERADERLGYSLSRICWEGPEDQLTLTQNAQPALLVHSAAVWEMIRDAELDVVAAAGHSLGEFSAYTAAGTFSFEDAVETVHLRGALMFVAGRQRPGTMAAVLGLDDAVVEQVCREASAGEDEVAVAANFNAPGQTVISGDAAAVERASALAVGAGAKKVTGLKVSGAFHSPLMNAAERGLEEHLDAVAMKDPAFPVISNVSTSPVSGIVEARALLIEQLTSPVRWTACVRTLLGLGATQFLEVGTGKVLTGMLKRIDRAAEGRGTPLGTAEQIDAYLGSRTGG